MTIMIFFVLPQINFLHVPQWSPATVDPTKDNGEGRRQEFSSFCRTSSKAYRSSWHLQWEQAILSHHKRWEAPGKGRVLSLPNAHQHTVKCVEEASGITTLSRIWLEHYRDSQNSSSDLVVIHQFVNERLNVLSVSHEDWKRDGRYGTLSAVCRNVLLVERRFYSLCSL